MTVLLSADRSVNCCQNKIMWQPPMEGEDMDEMGSGYEQQQSASVAKKPEEVNSENEIAAAEPETTADKVTHDASNILHPGGGSKSYYNYFSVNGWMRWCCQCDFRFNLFFSFSFVLVLQYFFVLVSVLPTTKEYQTC